jgi:hypothetical protein
MAVNDHLSLSGDTRTRGTNPDPLAWPHRSKHEDATALLTINQALGLEKDHR